MSSTDLEVKKSQLAELIELAKADGQVDAHEAVLVKNVAMHLGIAPEEFTKVVANPDMVMFRRSYDEMENRKRFYQALMMMQMDLKTHPEELSFCQELGLKLGLESSKVNRALKVLVEQGGTLEFDAFSTLMD
ncbi:MAG: TerB family tellurite resistance protein [Salibacteraceae bacterium]